MPTVKGIPGPYRVFFYSFDCGEPMHVHVERDGASCKFWLAPLMLASNDGCGPTELRRIKPLILENTEQIGRAWDEHCSKR